MKDDHVAILLGRIEDKLARFAEAMADVPARLTAIEERLYSLEGDMRVVKAVMTDQSKELHDHERRITTLEATQH